MAGVRIVTDSACDLPPSLADDLGIAIVPLTIRFGEIEYVDRRDLSTSEFWAKCASSDVLPETAAPSPGTFEASYRELSEAGADAIVTINLSGDLSATIEAARTAARAVEDVIDVLVVNSRTVSMGLGMLVAEAAEMAADGASAEEIRAATEASANRTRVHAALDTLDNLKKGGRIGAAQSLVGSLLQIKPLIEVRDGLVEPNGKQRTRSRALAHLVDQVRSEPSVERLAVLHAACDDIDEFLASLSGLYDGEIIVGEVGAVIGAHAGPGTIGVAYRVPG